MPTRDWNERYENGDLPWDTGETDEHLARLVESGRVVPGKALEVGCGTGTNSLWLARQGFDVLGLDVAPAALERANQKLAGESLSCRFGLLDFVRDDSLTASYDFVFDRGCFHIYDDDADRFQFAKQVSRVLKAGGVWFSLIGSTEGGPRDTGPPRRTANDVVAAIEPHLEILELRSVVFRTTHPHEAMAWHCLATQRKEPAQPSTRRD